MRKLPWSARIVACFVAIVMYGSTARATYSIHIITPVGGTQFTSAAPFSVNGTSNWSSFFDTTPSFVDLIVTDTDETSVILEVNANWSQSTGDWTQPNDSNGVSLLHAPVGSPMSVDYFSFKATLYVGMNAVDLEVKAYLVKGPGMP